MLEGCPHLVSNCGWYGIVSKVGFMSGKKLYWSLLLLCGWSITITEFLLLLQCTERWWVFPFACPSPFYFAPIIFPSFMCFWFESLNLYSFPISLIELLFIVLLLYLDVWLSSWFVFFVTRQTNIGYWNSSACHVQIEEVRSRLNLDVTVASDSPPAPAPIESFTDMVFNFVNI